MSKPKPKAEIVIVSIGNPLYITTHSNDAFQFVKKHAPDFGSYYAPNNIDKHHTLFVQDGYDVREVADYLKAMQS